MPAGHKHRKPSRWLRKFRAILLSGLIVIVPIVLTIWILVWLFEAIDGLLRPLTVHIFGQQIIGLGFAVILILVLIVGVIATNVIGRKILKWIEEILSKVPVSRMLYVTIKQIFQSFADPKKTGFLKVVLVQFPRKGIYSVGFVTNIHRQENGQTLYNVFIPTSPNPTGGFLQILDESEVVQTALSVEEGLKMVVSAGRISSEVVVNKVIQAKTADENKVKQTENR